MKLIIEQSDEHREVEIRISCNLIDERLERLIAQIRLFAFSITGKKDGVHHLLRLEDIYYFESIDNKSFMYSQQDVYECTQRLYELEQQLNGTHFVRVSKSCILNVSKLSGIRGLINGKFEAQLDNGEKIIINRHYVQALKAMISF